MVVSLQAAGVSLIKPSCCVHTHSTRRQKLETEEAAFNAEPVKKTLQKSKDNIEACFFINTSYNTGEIY